MPSSGSFGPIRAWVTGVWTSQLLDVSLQSFPSSGDNKWGVLRWFEEGTDDEGKARVRVNILDSNNAALQSDLDGSVIANNTRFNRSIDLSLLANVATVDVKVRFKLQSLTEQPVVSNVELNTSNSW